MDNQGMVSIDTMVKDLTNRYDYISKKDAAIYLKNLYGRLSFSNFLKAYKIAYE